MTTTGVPIAPAVPAARRGTRLPRPRPMRADDLRALIALSGALVVGMWIRHGGLAQVGSLGGTLTAVGQVTALLGTWLALVGILLMSRAPWIDRTVPTDRLLRWHRLTGFWCVWLIVGHAASTTLGWAIADGVSVIEELRTLLGFRDILASVAALGLFVLVAVTSMRFARRRLSRETWYGIHLYVYLALVLAFFHELSMGSDLAIGDQAALGYWVALYVVALGSLLVWRVAAPIVLTLRHRPVVVGVVPEAPGVVSIVLAGRRFDRMAVRAGQFFQVRLLTGGGWWRPHPFSISAMPDGRTLRFTVRDLGDDTSRMMALRPGTRAFLEGPYGTFTTEEVGDQGVALFAGGIGITPLRAMLEELPPGLGRAVLLFRASSWEEIVFREELDALAAERGFSVRYLVGRRGSPEMPVDPLAPEWIEQLVPDIRRRVSFICGSDGFMDRVEAGLRTLKVPTERIHAERFSF